MYLVTADVLLGFYDLHPPLSYLNPKPPPLNRSLNHLLPIPPLIHIEHWPVGLHPRAITINSTIIVITILITAPIKMVMHFSGGSLIRCALE